VSVGTATEGVGFSVNRTGADFGLGFSRIADLGGGAGRGTAGGVVSTGVATAGGTPGPFSSATAFCGVSVVAGFEQLVSRKNIGNTVNISGNSLRTRVFITPPVLPH